MDGQNDSIVLEEEIDPNYEPTEREVLEYATWLGMDLEGEQDLFWIAREGLKAPLPENWKPCKTTDTEEIYYFNFATGQSTWDHPCDENAAPNSHQFYRNLYEENKKKRTGSSKKAQDTDEKRRKEKEDVAELLGRKGSSGKKKKASLSKADPLGPPTLGKANPLEKKPLPGLSSKLGALGAIGGGPTIGGLRSATSLGRLKSEAKDADDSKDDGDDSSDEQPLSLGGLSKPPLGGLLTKKPLPSSGASASLSRRDSAAEIDGLAADFEQKKQKILDDQAAAMRDMEEAHQQAVDTLQKKLQKQLSELQEEGESSVRQKKRELDKKLNDLENQFDKDENSLLRERKEKMKCMESDGEAALAEKRQELEVEMKKETNRIEARHETKLRELKDEHDREEKQLEAKLKATLGEKAQDANTARELRDRSDKLTKDLASLEKELESTRSEKRSLTQDKDNAESKLAQAQREVVTLQSDIALLRGSNSSATSEQSKRADALAEELASLTIALESIRTEKSELAHGKSEAESKLTQAQREVEALTREVSSLQDSVADKSERSGRAEELSAELESLNAELEAVRAERDSLAHGKLGTESKLTQAQREVEALKSEVTSLRRGDAGAGSDKSDRAEEEVAAELNLLRAELEAVRTDKVSLAQSKSDIESALTQAQLKLQTLERDAARDIEAARFEKDALAHEKIQVESTLKRDLERLQSEVTSLRGNAASTESELAGRADELAQELASLKVELESVLAEKDELARGKSDAEAQLTHAQHELERLQREVDTQYESSTGAANEQSDRAEKLSQEVKALKIELEALGSENDRLVQDKSAIELKLKQAQHDVDGLEAEVVSLRGNNASAANEQSDRAEKLALEVRSLKKELEAARAEQELEYQALTAAESKLSASQTKENELRSEMLTLCEQENALHNELAHLQQKNAALIDENVRLEASKRDAPDPAQVAAREAKLKQDLLATQAEASNLKAEACELQDQLMVLTKTNAQIKGQLLKESNEKKSLREQLDTQDSDKRHLEAEKTLLARQLKELTESKRQHEQSSALEAQAELTRQKWEIEQLQATLKVANDTKARLDERVKLQEGELESQRQREQAMEAESHANLTRQKREIEQLQVTLKSANDAKARLEERVKHLEEEVETQRRREQSSTLESQSELTRQSRGLEQLQATMKIASSDRDRLEERVRALESELETQRQQEQTKTLESHAELTRQKWEIEQLQATLKVANGDKGHLEERAKLLENEVASLMTANSQLSEKTRVSAYKAIELENELRNATVERDRALQLKALVESQRQNEHSSTLEAQAELTRQKWEIEQLQVAAKAVSNDKARFEEKAKLLEVEVESLMTANSELTEKARASAYKVVELENELRVERERASDSKNGPNKVQRDRPARDENDASSSRRSHRGQSSSAREYRKWNRRLEVEIEVLAKMQALVMDQRRELQKRAGDKLRSRHSSARVRGGGSNNNRNTSGDDDDGDLSDGECNQSEIDSLLDTLEKLNDDLVSEAGDVSGGLAAEGGGYRHRAPPMERYRGWEYVPEVDHVRGYCPSSYAVVPPNYAPMWRYPPNTSLSRVPMAGQPVVGFESFYLPGADMYAPTTTSHLGRPFPQRMSNLSRRTRGSNERAPERTDTFQRQISRWAKDRERVQHAATRHASWLNGMCEELRRYGARYNQDAEERREAAAITSLDTEEGA